MLERRSPISTWRPTRLPAAHSIGDLSQHAVTNQTPSPFPEPHAVNQKMGTLASEKSHATSSLGSGGAVVRLLASNIGEPGLILRRVAPGFSHVGIVPDDVVGRRDFLGDFPCEIAACSANSRAAHTGQQYGVTYQRHVRTPFANQRLATYSPAGSQANRKLNAGFSIQSETRPVPKVSHRNRKQISVASTLYRRLSVGKRWVREYARFVQSLKDGNGFKLKRQSTGSSVRIKTVHDKALGTDLLVSDWLWRWTASRLKYPAWRPAGAGQVGIPRFRGKTAAALSPPRRCPLTPPYTLIIDVTSAVRYTGLPAGRDASSGTMVAELLVCSPPNKTIRVQSSVGSLRIFACGNRAGRCRQSVGFLGDPPLLLPFHSGTAPYSPQSPSSALKTSTLRAAKSLHSLAVQSSHKINGVAVTLVWAC
ncbi:hypothetical protein PR048_008797 [Dryococelus australis]|uniref:Uncharacterized protein n=1 Tax=Dryococelus australis TaxID=614101 RepID=A0ABQ9HZ05_9NEOP|nr:hypothetical protein PR048_008797 [Dryococelus australis]